MGNNNITGVAVTCLSNVVSLSATPIVTVPVNLSTATSYSGSIVVTNTGHVRATNISAELPSLWTSGSKPIVQDALACSVLEPGANCTLILTATAPYIAQSGITITADNLAQALKPSVTVGFSLNGYMVFSIDPSTLKALVVASSDILNGQNLNLHEWGSYSISQAQPTFETSFTPAQGCNGATDGSCNTSALWTASAAATVSNGQCYSITSDSTGTVAQGTWFLPAICQMGPAGQGPIAESPGCPIGMDNIDTNLFQHGFSSSLNLDHSAGYFSSTAYSGSTSQPSTGNNTNTSSNLLIWVQIFRAGGNSSQSTGIYGFAPGGSSSYAVHCIRSISYAPTGG